MGKADGLRTLGLLLNDDEIQYVVKADVAAFYEYIDHGILGRLLVGRSHAVDLIQTVLEILAEIEGRGYGLPQMFEASDNLSEIYAQLLQDQMLRRGHLIWRFNDDFRIGVPSFAAALDAIEALSEEARALGLILNEQKTVTPKFVNYAMSTFGLNNINEDIPPDETDEVEAAVAEYTETFEDPDDAIGLLVDATSGEGNLDLGNIGHDDAARLRREIWTAVRAEDARALDAIVPLAIYVPSLTPVLCRYAEALVADHPAEVCHRVDVLISTVSLGGWQRMWLSRLLRSANLLALQLGDRARRVTFAQDNLNDSRHAVTRAEAALALAPTGEVPIERFAGSLVTEPRARLVVRPGCCRGGAVRPR